MAWFRPRRAVTAAATVVSGPPAPDPNGSMRRQLYRTPDTWQREAWDLYDSLGEFRQGATWKANMLSRVRLRAARKVQGEDEPQIVEDGPAAELVAELAGGVGGRSELMSSFSVYLDVPGECYLIGETPPDGANKWYARSIEELQPAPGMPGRWKVSEGFGRWRLLPDDSLVVRVHRPHKRWHSVADSPARAARPLMRELELINRHIQSQYMSRLASAGIVIFPDEITFPVRPEFADAPDPFVLEWIEIAAEAIQTPGTAAAVVPIPIRVAGEYVDKIKHIDFTLKLDDQIIVKRDSSIARLAIALDMPAEALLGTRDVNHWNLWLVDEQGVKIHVAPAVELICSALTEGYLAPRLTVAGEDPADWVVWYDASELILRPDKSKAATDAYDRGEFNGRGLRRELGLEDADTPDDDELKEILLKNAALTQPVNMPAALAQLFPELRDDMLPAPPVDAPRPDPTDQPPPDKPGAREKGPQPEPVPPAKAPANGKAAADLARTLTRQAGLMHAVKIGFDGRSLTGVQGMGGSSWSLLHPPDCADHLFSCPVTHATWAPLIALPGASGVYRCWVNQHGQPIIGDRLPDGAADGMIESTAANGRTRTLLVQVPAAQPPDDDTDAEG